MIQTWSMEAHQNTFLVFELKSPVKVTQIQFVEKHLLGVSNNVLCSHLFINVFLNISLFHPLDQ